MIVPVPVVTSTVEMPLVPSEGLKPARRSGHRCPSTFGADTPNPLSGIETPKVIDDPVKLIGGKTFGGSLPGAGAGLWPAGPPVYQQPASPRRPQWHCPGAPVPHPQRCVQRTTRRQGSSRPRHRGRSVSSQCGAKFSGHRARCCRGRGNKKPPGRVGVRRDAAGVSRQSGDRIRLRRHYKGGVAAARDRRHLTRSSLPSTALAPGPWLSWRPPRHKTRTLPKGEGRPPSKGRR